MNQTLVDLVVIVPVLGRPERVQPFLDSFAGAEGLVKYRALFVCSPGDDAELDAVDAAKLGEHRAGFADVVEAPWKCGRGDYARKINLAFGLTREPWLFMAADDLRFHLYWADRAVAAALAADALVVGTNDLGSPRVVAGQHATHSLVHRSYGVEHGTVDGPGRLLYEGYWHNFVDDEFVQLAKSRGLFTFASDSRVEHLHPHWGKADVDATYRRGEEHFDEDGRLFDERKTLWA